tara:strand:- start:920 stop:1204 length:285 start_codon:yes stop_codon:yes gene_type:complete
MTKNESNNTEQDVQQIVENNQKLVQIAQNQADVITELRQMNSDKDLRIAELSATIKRIQNQISAAQAKADEEIDEIDTEFEEVVDDEDSANEQE